MSDWQAEIDSLEAQVKATIAELDQLAGAFIAAARGNLAQFVDDWMKREIEKGASVVNAMPEAELAEMKQQFKDYKSRLPRLIDSAFPRKRWPHCYPDEEFAETIEPLIQYNKLDSISGQLRNVLPDFGAILFAHNITDDHKAWSGSKEAPQYSYGLSLPKPIEDVAAEYHRKLRSLVELRRNLRYRREAKEKADAAARWAD